jgi:hypothetical protein
VLAVLAAIGCWLYWSASRQPTYLPPRGDEIAILLELAGVFPDNYGIMWREHGALRSTDPEAKSDPSMLGEALFMHRLTTGSEGDVRVEVEYRFFAFDHDSDDKPDSLCACDTLDSTTTSCRGRLAFGNYQFSLSVNYNHEACTDPVSPKRNEEFRRTMHTADRLIGLYLEPLRRKSSGL